MIRLALLFVCLTALPLRAEQALIAVAANFIKPAMVLAQGYEAETGHRIVFARGSTGQHYAQILHGAPYDAFLAADAERPKRLAEQGLAGLPFSYAVGRLAYVAPQLGGQDWPQAALMAGRIAVASPKLAPYGRAAQQALKAKGLTGRVVTVQGLNVGQAFAMVASGAVPGGLVALSLALDWNGPYRTVSADLHDPILQDAVLLRHGQGNLAAQGFLDYLASDAALAVLQTYGYDRP